MDKFIILRGAGAKRRRSIEEGVAIIQVASMSSRQAADMRRDDTVAAITPEMPTALIEAFAAEEASGAAWGIEAVGADQLSVTGAGVKVAVLDTGIDAAHPAFAGVKLEQRDFTGEGDGDGRGHGTHCAGTIFGRDVDGKRIGVARGVTEALIGKVLDGSGRGGTAALFSAIHWALEGGARVISMSLGFDFPGMVERAVRAGARLDVATSQALFAYRANLRMFDALMQLAQAREAIDGGALVIAAAGNESRRPEYEIAVSLPAAAEGVVSVAAFERKDGRLGVASFSNTFADVGAPGVGIVSAAAGGSLRALSGTSMATPHVAGVAALWWEDLAKRTVPQRKASLVKDKLIGTARDDLFVDGLSAADRGAGLVTSPPANLR